jgi:succinate dehydrogenase / fumarate reductase flavoprotein subunit
MWEYCGMSRSEQGLKKAKKIIQDLKAEFWTNVNVLGTTSELNQELEKANRVADFIELGELMVDDALNRAESCGGHFREESQTPEGEAMRKDDEYAYVAAWEFKGENQPEELHKEELKFENVKLTQRSYK